MNQAPHTDASTGSSLRLLSDLSCVGEVSVEQRRECIAAERIWRCESSAAVTSVAASGRRTRRRHSYCRMLSPIDYETANAA